MEESAAVRRMQRGDAGGLEALVRLHYTRAVRAAYLISRDKGLAEDVVQGAFVRAYEGIGSFDEARPFWPWFAKIVVNEAVKASSRRDRTISFYAGDLGDLLARLADTGPGPHEAAEESEARRRVWAALERLPAAQRAVIVQRYYLGMSEAEMAEKAGSSRGTIKSRLNAARRRLSAFLRP